jgi:hypothetical protein
MALLNWPTAKAYDVALLDRATTFTDPAIKQGNLTADAFVPIRFNGAGKYVCVYQVSDWFVRCFTETAPDDLRERYRAIATFVTSNSTSMPFLLEQTWVEQGIRVQGRVVPFLKVPRVLNSQTLGTFLEEHYQDSARVAEVARALLAMMKQLEGAQVAHGDLDITNILVIDDGRARHLLKLIDYDGMYVPSMARLGLKPIDLGHVHFQHPRTEKIRTFGPQMDRFSAVVLYLSLIAIAASPSVWENCGANDTERLVFNETDYLNFTAAGSNSYRILAKLQHKNADILKCLQALEQSIRTDQMPGSLEQILGGAHNVGPAPEPAATRHSVFRPIPIPVSEPETVPPPLRAPVPPPVQVPRPGPAPAPFPPPRTPQPVSLLAVFTGLFLVCSGICAPIVLSHQAGLVANALGVLFSSLALACDTALLYRAPLPARGWKVFFLILALVLLILNAVR